jgi:hypothetical protein
MLSDITLFDFQFFTKKEKLEALCEYAVQLCERPHEELRIVLYQINNFYVEVLYSKVNNSVVEFQSSINTKLVEPYLKQIDISYLITA